MRNKLFQKLPFQSGAISKKILIYFFNTEVELIALKARSKKWLAWLADPVND